jgi:GNAT superfamily N-acetyltransferase
MTDVLGVCVSWGEVSCVVQPEVGPSVTIALGDIVSGKLVPPRPSARARVAAREAQVRAFAMFPDLRVTPVPGGSGWLLRSSPTATARRANSALAFPGGSPSGAEILSIEAHYSGLGKPTVAAVLGDSDERAYFAGLGWVPESHEVDSRFQLASVASVRRALTRVDHSRAVLASDGVTATAQITGSGQVIARGVAAYAEEWVGFRGLQVSVAHRRQGLGRAVLAALAAWGAELGATTAYLQVLGDNEPALAMYESMGFRTHHTYAYLTPRPTRGGARHGGAPSRGSAPTAG